MSQYLGQHFLKNKSAIKKIIASLDLHSGETIIEIGPGKGALTFPLLHECNKIGAKLIAIEKDRELALMLFKSDSELIIELGDALEILPALSKSYKQKTSAQGGSLPAGGHGASGEKSYKIVGNIPFYITGKLLRTISELENKPELTVLMIQKEVAERICAGQERMNPVRGREGSPHTSSLRGRQRASASNGMNLLAAATQIWAKPKILFTLSPEDFDPPPKVHSAVIRLESRSKNLESGIMENYYKLIHVIFKQPRKTLYNNLRDGLELPAENIKKALDDMKIDLKSRPQDLSVEQILVLSEKTNKNLKK